MTDWIDDAAEAIADRFMAVFSERAEIRDFIREHYERHLAETRPAREAMIEAAIDAGIEDRLPEPEHCLSCGAPVDPGEDDCEECLEDQREDDFLRGRI